MNFGGVLGDVYQDDDLVVALSNGRPCEDRIILKELEKLWENAGLPRVVFHPLHHSSITYKLKPTTAPEGHSGRYGTHRE